MPEHVNIEDSQRHEPKGASTASAGQVIKSNGDGTTTFGQVAYSELSGAPVGAAVADLAGGADLPTTVTKVNELLASLRTAGLIGT